MTIILSKSKTIYNELSKWNVFLKYMYTESQKHNNNFQHTLKENQSSSSLLRNFIKNFYQILFSKDFQIDWSCTEVR